MARSTLTLRDFHNSKRYDVIQVSDMPCVRGERRLLVDNTCCTNTTALGTHATKSNQV